MNINKQLYSAPAAEVMAVRIESGLLTVTNGVESSREDYGAAETEEWD